MNAQLLVVEGIASGQGGLEKMRRVTQLSVSKHAAGHAEKHAPKPKSPSPS